MRSTTETGGAAHPQKGGGGPGGTTGHVLKFGFFSGLPKSVMGQLSAVLALDQGLLASNTRTSRV